MSLLVGLTGGIGSGKSLAAKMFGLLSAKIIDADMIARELVRPGKIAWKEIVEYFGQKILSATDEIDRSILGKIIFDDYKKRKILETILHPKIIDEEFRIYDQMKSSDPDVLVILEAALLIETGNYRNVDRVVVISCQDEERIRRLIKRDGMQRRDIEKRLEVQMQLDDKLKCADFLLKNDGSIAELEHQVQNLYLILSKYK